MMELDYAAIRQRNLAQLSQRGFQVPGDLPLGQRGGRGELREPLEIAKRLWALDCLFDFVAASKKLVPTMKICKCMLRSDLRRYLTADELYVLDGWRSKAQRRHIDTIGWRLENMLPLAWVLGYKAAPEVDGIMLEGEPAKELIKGFLGSLEQNVTTWLAHRSVRDSAEVIEREDLFFCAYSAVLRAEAGEAAVPAGFDPVASGGVLQERLHSLTWAISPGVSWDDTDLPR